MKKIKILFILLISVFTMPIFVNASATLIAVGNEKLNIGETKNIFGGEVKFEKESASNYVLTLKDVTIDKFLDSGSSRIAVYFVDGNLTIKLEGNNTITSTKEAGSAANAYMAMADKKTGETRSLTITGNGTLNINIAGYETINGLYSDYVSVGKENDNNGPKINVNINGSDTSTVYFINSEYDIYNSTIKGNLSGYNAVALYSDEDNTAKILNSDINFELEGESNVYGIYEIETENISIENTDMLIKLKSKENKTPAKWGISGYELITIKDSRVILLSLDNGTQDSAVLTNGTPGNVKFIHTEGKDFLFLTNFGMTLMGNNEYTNITNKMVYVSDSSLDNVKQEDTFDLDTLKSKKYIVISTDIDNKVTSGDNQTIRQTIDTSYEFVTNHFMYLVKNVMLDDTLLSSEDYTLNETGGVTLTNTGVNKLHAANLGTHKIGVNYYFGNKVTSNINLVSKDYVEESEKQNTNVEPNPKTGDDIVSSIIIGTISLISLIGCGLFINKKRFE